MAYTTPVAHSCDAHRVKTNNLNLKIYQHPIKLTIDKLIKNQQAPGLLS